MSMPLSGSSAQPHEGVASTELTGEQRAILEFERERFSGNGASDQEIREIFNLSTTRYFQQLNALIDLPAALRYDPLVVKRLRRLREQRQQARSATRLRG